MDVRKTSSDGYFVGFRVSTCVKSGGLLKLKIIITTLKDEERKNCLTAELARRKRERELAREKEGRRRKKKEGAVS